ncbi:MAG: tetratricopeptide repeat protein [Pirellulales bacterium]|nr:tetratricopeptide repeat protein [Pirellulales bacterium]
MVPVLGAICAETSLVSAQQRPAASSNAAKRAYAAAAAFQNEGVVELAVEDWEEFLKRFDDDPLAANARFNLGACYFKLGKYDQAADGFAALAEKHPAFDLAETNLLNFGIANFKAAQAAGGNPGRFNQAAAALDRFLKQFPQSNDVSQALMLRAQALAAAGRQSEAIASWTEWMERHPTAQQSAETLYAVGMGLLEGNRVNDARKIFARLQREHNAHPLAGAALFELGEYEFHQQKDFAAAVASYRAAKERTGNADLAEKIDYKLGWAYFQLHDFPRAEQTFASLLSQRPEGKLVADAELMCGECSFKQGQWAAAFPHFSSALEGKLSSNDLVALALLRAGQCAVQLKRYDEALKFLDRLAREHAASPYQTEATLQRAIALESLGRRDEALQQYRAAAEQTASPLAMQAQFMIGHLQAAAGNHREAVRSFYRVIHGFDGVKPTSAQHDFKALALYEAARSFDTLQNDDQALRLYAAFLERDPNSDHAAAARQRLEALKRSPER